MITSELGSSLGKCAALAEEWMPCLETEMVKVHYAVVDVFADKPLRGNPAAVVFDADELSDEQMQGIAREFNLSETAFILTPKEAAHTADVRIFVPTNEIPFAGHPNIGAAFALASRQSLGSDELVFAEKAGLVRLNIERQDREIVGATLIAPQTLSVLPGPSLAATAAALSLAERDIVAATHPPIIASVGLEFLFVQLSSKAALGSARVSMPAFDSIRDSHHVLGAHLYFSEDASGAVHKIQARNLSPYDGIGEDPATGSATASLAAFLAYCSADPNCDVNLEAHQGIEMGRPSILHSTATKRGGEVQRPQLTGRCVQVMSGTLLV